VHTIATKVGPFFNTALSADERVAITHMEPGASPQVWLFDNGALRALTHFAPADGAPQWPSWTSDGQTIAVQAGVYNQRQPETNTAHIWRVNVATGAATKLAAHDRPYLDETPAYFPDGTRLAFQSNRTGRMEVWIMNADGTGARQLTK
jgi:Tol biopolymer transport system component